MTHIETISGDLAVHVTKEGELVLRVVDSENYAHEIEVADKDKLIRALNKGDLVAVERRQAAVEREYGGRCTVPMIHPDKSEAQCVLPRKHLLDDSDHVDEHGHHAPVLVHQSTIRDVQRVQSLRDAGLID